MRYRLADGLVLGFAGWCFVSLVLEKFPPSSRVVETLLLLLFSFFGALLGLFLGNLDSVFAKSGSRARVLVSLTRVIATGAIGVYAIDRFIEGCADGLAVLCFSVFLFLLLRMLNRRPQPTVSPSSGAHPSGQLMSGTAVDPRLVKHSGAVLASEGGEKLRELFAMVTSGVCTGLLGGALRATAHSENLGDRPTVFCLLPISVIVFGVLVRLACVRLIQGQQKLKGWRTGLAIVDGLIVSTLLAIAVCAELPPAISWEGTVSKNQLLWIPLGLMLGFTWGVVFGSLKILFFRALKHFVDPDEPGEHRSSPLRRALGLSVEIAGEGEYNVEHQHRDHRQVEVPGAASSGVHLPEPSDVAEKRQGDHPRRSKVGLSCSCLLAASALVASMVFALAASMGIWKFEKINKDIGRLPKGCPKACQDVVLDKFRLELVDFSGANLSRAKLREADFEGANFRGAILRDALLFRADLRDAVLSGADFSGADLRRTILLKARFENTRLRGAYLSYATLQDLDLSTADLEGADLRDAVYSKKTKWPPGFDIQKAGLRLDE